MKNWLLLSAMLLANSVLAADLPAQGKSMASVLKQFGAPVQKTGPVGSPPITRWVYNDFTVVFEYKHVVHSMTVKHEGAAPASTTAPASTSGKGEASLSVEVK